MQECAPHVVRESIDFSSDGERVDTPFISTMYIVNYLNETLDLLSKTSNFSLECFLFVAGLSKPQYLIHYFLFL